MHSSSPLQKRARQALSTRELELEARKLLDPAVYDFVAGGAEDEFTLRANEAAFARIGLVPRILCGKGSPDLAINLLGRPATMPVLIAPTAFHRLAHPDGERATARAAASAGVIMIASMASTVAIEEVAAAAREKATGVGPNLWFQLYIQHDLGFTETIIRRAEEAGCNTLAVSVDSPTFGRRERDEHNGFRDLPPGLCCENLREASGGSQLVRPRSIVFSPEISWQHIDWLRKITNLKIVLKGVMHPADARLAVDAGIDALIVSNHGGRQLDTVPATIELLPAIRDTVLGRIPLLIDGGIRRGTDIVKALALGATAVAVGRPIFWGLATAGEQGVTQVLDMLRSELVRALTLCGCGSPCDASSDLLWFRRTEEPCWGS
jgi:4-hydroxymandelate oxidase